MITENETERGCQGLEEDKAEFRLETKRLDCFLAQLARFLSTSFSFAPWTDRQTWTSWSSRYVMLRAAFLSRFSAAWSRRLCSRWGPRGRRAGIRGAAGAPQGPGPRRLPGAGSHPGRLPAPPRAASPRPVVSGRGARGADRASDAHLARGARPLGKVARATPPLCPRAALAARAACSRCGPGGRGAAATAARGPARTRTPARSRLRGRCPGRELAGGGATAPEKGLEGSPQPQERTRPGGGGRAPRGGAGRAPRPAPCGRRCPTRGAPRSLRAPSPSLAPRRSGASRLHFAPLCLWALLPAVPV